MKTVSNIRRVMMPSEIVARVNKLAPKILEGLAPDDLAIVLSAATLRRFQAHTIIIDEGQAADKLFLIIEGRARTFTMTRKGEKVLLLWVPEGDGSGGRALLSMPAENLVSTETVMDSYALVWNRSTILALTKKYPILLENALMIASGYLESYRDMHVAASFYTANQRVARVLEGLAKGIGERVEEGIELVISNEDVANEANVTIFTVSRLLSEWQRKGMLIKRRGKIILRLPEDLIRSAS
jgi:CRP/FNR family transcriptional regulator, nitrogen oxide reductase regulator